MVADHVYIECLDLHVHPDLAQRALNDLRILVNGRIARAEFKFDGLVFVARLVQQLPGLRRVVIILRSRVICP